MTHLEFTANVTSWDEAAYLEFDGDKAKLTRARVAQTLADGMQGECVTEYLMAYQSDGTAAFVGQQHWVGTLDGRTGAFVTQVQGSFDGTEARGSWSVVPGSGRGGLRGLRGEGSYSAPHGSVAYTTFDYEFD